MWRVCAQEEKGDPCIRWSRCKTCQDGSDGCLECPDGLEGPLCRTATGVKSLSRRRRFYYPHRKYAPHPVLPIKKRKNCKNCNNYQDPYSSSTYFTDSAHQGVDSCPELKSPKLGNIRCVNTEQKSSCVGKCLPGYKFEGHGSETVMTLTCERGHYTPLEEFPPCQSGGHCGMVAVGSGSFNCTTDMGGTRCDVVCDNMYAGRFYCYPGQEWDPPLPDCVVPKETEREICECEYGGSCNSKGECVCPVGRTGKHCEKISSLRGLVYCQDPGRDPNGKRKAWSAPSYRGFPQGTRIEYSCNQDYTLDGEKNIFCETSGTWSSERPWCKAQPRELDVEFIACINPGPISNGNVAYFPPLNAMQKEYRQSPLNDFRYPPGGLLRYSCDNGYVLKGSGFLSCNVNGEWSSDPPVCKLDVEVVHCLNPGPILNGQIEYYPPFDSSERQHQQTPLNGRIYPKGGLLRYSCNNDYTLEGSGLLNCGENGQWSSEPPVCKKENQFCKDPGVDPNGSRNPRLAPDARGFLPGAIVEYFCNEGYELDGEKMVFCYSGEWLAERPNCTPKFRAPVPGRMPYCDYPGPIPNGKVVVFQPVNEMGQLTSSAVAKYEEFVEYPLGSRLMFICDNGYNLHGTSNLTCDASGQWSAFVPSCITRDISQMLYCINPGPVLNGKISYHFPLAQPRSAGRSQEEDSEYPEGTRLKYHCDDGYNLDGPESLACQSNGIWSKLPPKCVSDCGRSVMGTTRKILNGNKTSAGEWPWVVGIAVPEGNNYTRLICGGAVLNTWMVITAAHCLVRDNQYILYFGKYYSSNRRDDDLVQVRTSDSVILHPDYDNATLDSDIALITFKDKIKYTIRVQPICIPDAETTAKDLYIGSRGYVTGWGITEKRLGSSELLKASLPFVNTAECYQSFVDNVPNYNPTITSNMFCAGYHDAQQTTCKGDSGGALVFYDALTERYTLEGLVSYTVEGQCGLPGRYSVFTTVYRFVPWIFRNMVKKAH